MGPSDWMMMEGTSLRTRTELWLAQPVEGLIAVLPLRLCVSHVCCAVLECANVLVCLFMLLVFTGLFFCPQADVQRAIVQQCSSWC